MASQEPEERPQVDKIVAEPNDSDSSSDDGVSSDEEAAGAKEDATPVEWLATGRERRSTAGNRMKSMLAAEEPDDELELLFAEDDDDAGFTDVAEDASDVQMDSSSDDEDAQENGDELEGEKELEKRARESRQAARKRKAQEAIPLKFRKKVKIHTSAAAAADAAATPGSSSTPTTEQPKPPRPKKKSERTSWLPLEATRASKRGTTMLSKEQLHRQMIEREVKRLKQVEAMERKAQRMAALQKPPLTQAERLAEAAVVEKKNAKSLNRWEEAEKQREEERRAKLAALNNRTLDGPVVTFWSGVGEWVDGKLRHVGKIVTIEDKPAKKKRASNAAHEEMAADVSTIGKEIAKPQEPSQDGANATPTPATAAGTKPEGETPTAPPGQSESKPENTTETTKDEPKETEGNPPETPKPGIVETSPSQRDAPANTEKPADTPAAAVQGTPAPPPVETIAQQSGSPHPAKPPETKPPEMKPPDIRPPASNNTYTTSMFAPPPQTGLMKPPEMKPPTTTTFLAPPAGAAQGGLSMPMIGYHAAPSNSSNVLAPPSTAQRQSPLSMPQAHAFPPPPAPASAPAPAPAQASAPAPATPSATTSAPTMVPTKAPATPQPLPFTAPATPKPPGPGRGRRPSSTPLGHQKSSHTNAAKQPEIAPPPPPSPPANGKATRNCIILQNFNENAIKEKSVQNRVLFGKEMSKLAKPPPAPRCVITNHPARYRDPKTGLPYYNSYAYKEIQKLQTGNYKWSSLVGAWVGSGEAAAQGVPARFLDPTAPGPPKPEPEPEPEFKPTEAAEGEEGTSHNPGVHPPETPTTASMPPSFSTPASSDPQESMALPTPVPQPTKSPSVGPPIVAPTAPSENKAQPAVPITPETTNLAPSLMAPPMAANDTMTNKDVHAPTATVPAPAGAAVAFNPVATAGGVVPGKTDPSPTQNTESAAAAAAKTTTATETATGPVS